MNKPIEPAITPRTRAIVPVHYLAWPARWTRSWKWPAGRNLLVIEDAAQALGSTYRTRALGESEDLGATSFHETKNLISGEGGALLVNSGELVERAEIFREKGTNRSRFFRGEIASTPGRSRVVLRGQRTDRRFLVGADGGR